MLHRLRTTLEYSKWAIRALTTILGSAIRNRINGQPFVEFYSSASSTRVISPLAMNTGEWTHLATTLSGTKLSIYVNGSLTVEGDVSGFVLRNVQRLNWFIGYSLLSSVGLPQARFDQIKIFNRSLTANEVFSDFQGPSIWFYLNHFRFLKLKLLIWFL